MSYSTPRDYDFIGSLISGRPLLHIVVAMSRNGVGLYQVGRSMIYDVGLDNCSAGHKNEPPKFYFISIAPRDAQLEISSSQL